MNDLDLVNMESRIKFLISAASKRSERRGFIPEGFREFLKNMVHELELSLSLIKIVRDKNSRLAKCESALRQIQSQKTSEKVSVNDFLSVIKAELKFIKGRKERSDYVDNEAFRQADRESFNKIEEMIAEIEKIQK